MKNWQKVKKWLRSNIKYLLLYLMLFTFMFLAWLIFINNKQITDIPLKVGGVISVSGLGFTLFQFGYNNTTTNKRRLYDLRYNAYKDIVLQVDTILDNININLSLRDSRDMQNFTTMLMNQMNRFSSIMSVNTYFLFQEINKTQEATSIKEVLSKILDSTETYKNKLIDEAKGNEALENIFLLNWHNEMSKNVLELLNVSEEFYCKIREYLK